MENWIENSSTLFNHNGNNLNLRQFRTYPEELLDTVEDDAHFFPSPTNYTKKSSKYETLYLELDHLRPNCKHICGKNKLYLPRSFQHHKLTRMMRLSYESQSYEVKKNFKCPPSACILESHLESDTSCNHSSSAGPIKRTDLINYRYLRSRDSRKEIMCRFCLGVNWVDSTIYFKHLFLAHGIITRLDNTTDWYHINQKKNNITTIKLEDYMTFYVQEVKSSAIQFTRNVLPHVVVRLLPIPSTYYSSIMGSGFRRTHVLCPNCNRYIRIGWCEHDEIIQRQYEDFESLNIQTFKEYSRISYIQTRNRQEIQGVYENYFVHYLECNFRDYDSTCLYIIFTD